MKNYGLSWFVFLVALVVPAGAQAELDELRDKIFALEYPQVSTLQTDTWYVMYNNGRKGYLYDGSSKLYISAAPPAANQLQYLVRLVENSGKVYLQTGLGRYFGTLKSSDNNGSTTTAKTAYTYGTISEGYFWLKDAAGMVLDANGAGATGGVTGSATVAGWGTTAPTTTTGNNSWSFYPVTISDIDFSGEDNERYTSGMFSLQNVENSQYLWVDSHNIGLDETEHFGSLNVSGNTWTVGIANASDALQYLHLGQESTFSAGAENNRTPAVLYHAERVGEDSYSFRPVVSVSNGGEYLIVCESGGHRYALTNAVLNSGSAGQRLRSSQVVEDSTGLSLQSVEGLTVESHLWRLNFDCALYQEPFSYITGETGGASGEGKPLLTIACISDIHTQNGWLSTNEMTDPSNGIYKPLPIADVKVRESLDEAVKALKNEGVDVVIVGGDCQSDATVDEEHWRQVRRLMADALRSIAPGKELPVLYVNGNHEYEVGSTWGGAQGHTYYQWRSTRPFNAGDYYDFPMLGDIGTLASQVDCYYEMADNDAYAVSRQKMPVMAAYHYNIKGFDFIVLNCGKYLFHNADNYSYSEESVAWVEQKLRQIYADDPGRQKTVFFALHIPFGDSNSINVVEDKGMSYMASTSHLKRVLAQYPNLIMLYGHDHGMDNAYLRIRTSQRVTRYDTNGHPLPTSDGNTYFNKGEMQADQTQFQYAYLHPYSAKTYLGVRGTYAASTGTLNRSLALLSEPNICALRAEGDTAVSIRLGNGSQSLCYNNGGFRMSTALHNPVHLYRADINGSTLTLTPVQQVEDGGVYLIEAGGSAFKVGGNKKIIWADTYALTAYQAYLWRAELPEEAEPGFISSFMGSMRYYGNSCGEPSNVTQDKRKLIQGLMVYVYPDRVVFDMKNFRNKVGSRVRNALTPFVAKRQVLQTTAESVVAHNPSKAYFRRVNDSTELHPRGVYLLANESGRKVVGIVNNATNRLQSSSFSMSHGHIPVTRTTDDCEFVLEGEPGAWFLRTRDGYIKNEGSAVYFRQQLTDFASSGVLSNEVMNGHVTPWDITFAEDGRVIVNHPELGTIQSYTSNQRTARLFLYQKVVEVPMDPHEGLGTLYSELPVIFPEGTTQAFTIDSVETDGRLRLTRWTNYMLPAKTGLLLHQDPLTLDSTATVVCRVGECRYDEPFSTNLLHGTLSTRQTPLEVDPQSGEVLSSNRYYTLAYAPGTEAGDTGAHLAFRPAEGVGTPFVNPAGHAYLVLPESLAEAYDSQTGSATSLLEQMAAAPVVDHVGSVREESVAQPVVYTLSGLCTTRAERGVYILNGRKIVR